MKANELNKAAEEYAYTNWESENYYEGASEGMPFDPIGHTEKCFKAGAEWQRERMLKDAVDGEVVSDLKGVNYIRSMSKISNTLRFGKKVKLIIVKD